MDFASSRLEATLVLKRFKAYVWSLWRQPVCGSLTVNGIFALCYSLPPL